MNKEQKHFLYLFAGLLGFSILGQFFNLFQISSHYHEFVDERNFMGISRVWDTVSNVAFLWVGCLFIKEIFLTDKKDHNLILVAIGSILVCFGSAYYHLLPADSRLLWDRLPIAVVFAGILNYSIHSNQMIKESMKNQFDIGYLLFSISAVLIWYIGSLYEKNWLGLYVFIQFGGMILLIYMAMTGKNKEFNKKIILVLLWYVLAKLAEHFDNQIYHMTNELFSGHTLKHILSAIALYQWFPKEEKEKIITRKTMKLGFWQLNYKA